MNENVAPKESFLKEVSRYALIALVVVLPIRLFIAQPFIVSGLSMFPTFHNAEYLIVDQISYSFEKPKRGDVIVFKYPKDPSKYFIKRVIALPNERIEIKNSKVIISNGENPSGFQLVEPYVQEETEGIVSTKLGNDEYFVMGDNRLQSADSRMWGTVKTNLIIGRPFVRLYPPQSFSLFPGAYEVATSVKK